jgi:hypothetical protein
MRRRAAVARSPSGSIVITVELFVVRRSRTRMVRSPFGELNLLDRGAEVSALPLSMPRVGAHQLMTRRVCQLVRIFG